MKQIGLRLEPLDTLFFRDGRPFTATSRAESTLPTPQNLTGALRTWLMRKLNVDFARFGKSMREGYSFAESLALQSQELKAIADIQLRGPWLAELEKDRVSDLFFSIPTVLKQIKGGNRHSELVRLAPLKKALPGWDSGDMLPVWASERRAVESLGGFLNREGMAEFLKGHTPSLKNKRNADQLYGFEERTGIGLDMHNQRPEDGAIYAIKLLRLAPNMGFYAHLSIPESLVEYIPHTHSWTLPWGGENRRVICQQTEMFEEFAAKEIQKDQLYTRVFTTPVLIESQHIVDSWKPVAVALSPWQSISGWDLALGGPKPLRWLLPAGSVLYFKPDQDIPVHFCSADAVQMGWGHYLIGVSDYV